VLVTAADGTATAWSSAGGSRRTLVRDRAAGREAVLDGSAQTLLGAFEPRAAISPDGTRAVVGNRRGVELYDLTDGHPLRRLAPPDATGAFALGVGPDRGWGVVTRAPRRPILFDIRDGRTVGSLRDSLYVDSFEAGGHGRFVAGTSFASDELELWDLAARTPVRRALRVRGAYFTLAAVDPRGRFVVAASSEGRLYVWRLPDRKLVQTLDLGTSARTLRFSPDGAYLAAAGYASSARVWDVKTWHKHVLRGHTSTLNSIAFDARATRVATSSDDGSVRVWTPQGELRAAIRPRWHGPVLDAQLSPDGSRIAMAGTHGAAIYDCELCGGPRQLYDYAKERVPLSR
jgi:WD40 repeat protein